MDNCKSGIYKIINLVNGKFYIGSTSNFNNRWTQHKYFLNKNMHGNKHLQEAFNKYGKENFKFEIIEYVKDRNKLAEREQYYLDFYNSFNSSCLYNILQTAYEIPFKRRKEEIIIWKKEIFEDDNFDLIYKDFFEIYDIDFITETYLNGKIEELLDRYEEYVDEWVERNWILERR